MSFPWERLRPGPTESTTPITTSGRRRVTRHRRPEGRRLERRRTAGGAPGLRPATELAPGVLRLVLLVEVVVVLDRDLFAVPDRAVTLRLEPADDLLMEGVPAADHLAVA